MGVVARCAPCQCRRSLRTRMTAECSGCEEAPWLASALGLSWKGLCTLTKYTPPLSRPAPSAALTQQRLRLCRRLNLAAALT